MVNPVMKVQQQVSRRAGRTVSEAQLAKVAEANAIPRVRVEPTREDLRTWLRHPNGMGFRPEGSSEWPMDRFTVRRLNDGDIKIVEEVKPPTRATRSSTMD